MTEAREAPYKGMGTRLSRSATLGRLRLFSRSIVPYLPLFALLAYLFFLFVLPISKMFVLSIFDPQPTLEHYAHFFTVPLYSERLIFTLEVAAIVSLLCVVLGYPVAYLLTVASPWMRNVALMMVISPLFISILVRTYGWMAILGREGVVNNTLMGLGLISSPLRIMHTTLGVYIGMVHVLLPYAILPTFSVMSGIDRVLLDAAQSLGARPLMAFMRVFFPLSLPGVAAGGLLIFMMALGFYVTPLLLGGPSDIMLANVIDVQITTNIQWGFGAAISVILLMTSLMLFGIYNRFLGLDRLFGGLT